MWPGASASSFTRPRPLTLPENLYLTDVLAVVEVRCTKSLPQIQGPLFGSVGPFNVDQKLELPLYIADALHAYCQIQPPIWLRPEGLQQWLEEEQKVDDLLPPPNVRFIEIAFRLLHHCESVEWGGPESGVYDRVLHLFDLLLAVRKRKIRELDNQFLDSLTVNSTNLDCAEKSQMSLPFAAYIRQIDAPTEAPINGVAEVLEMCFNLGDNLADHEKFVQKVKDDYGLI